jgi:hypothetical protein
MAPRASGRLHSRGGDGPQSVAEIHFSPGHFGDLTQPLAGQDQEMDGGAIGIADGRIGALDGEGLGQRGWCYPLSSVVRTATVTKLGADAS